MHILTYAYAYACAYAYVYGYSYVHVLCMPTLRADPTAV